MTDKPISSYLDSSDGFRIRSMEGATMQLPDQHVYHHSDKVGVSVNVKVEKNTKGYNWEVTVMGAATVAEALMIQNDAQTSLQAMYGTPAPTIEKTEK